MRALADFLFGCLVLPMLLGAEGTPNSAPPSESEPSALQIAVKRIEARRIASVEHTGAYWTVGPRFAELRKYMAKHRQPGPMFARFLSAPASVPADTLRTEIGFFVTDDHHPEPPYQLAVREPELVACLSVDAPFATPSRHLAMMRKWIDDHGFVATGPFTEIYHTDTDHEETSPHPHTLLQIAVRRPEPKAPENTRGADPPLVERSAQTLPTVQNGGTVAITGKPRRRTGDETAREALDKKASEPVGTKRAEPVVRATSAPPMATGRPTGQAGFGELAERMLPDDRSLPPSTQVWLGQIVFRVGAAAKGIERVYPGEGRAVRDLADAVTSRYKVVSADFTSDPLDHAVVHVDPESDPHAIEKKKIMRELDSLLGRIAFKSVDPEATVAELAEIMRRVHKTVQVQ